MKFFTSDQHLNHKRIIELSDRPFENMAEMNHILLTKMFSIPKGSDLYILGDLSWDRAGLELFLHMKPYGINTHLILGNHDNRMGNLSGLIGQKGFSSISQMKNIKEGDVHITLQHFPLVCWDRSYLPKSFHLYGHIHSNTPRVTPTGKMINVNCEFWDYDPISFDRVVEEMKSLPPNWEIKEIQKRNRTVK